MKLKLLAITTSIILGLAFVPNREFKYINKSQEDNSLTFSNDENREIYGTVTIERNWVVDPDDTKRVFQNLDDIFVVKAKVNSIEEDLFLEAEENYSNPHPFTPVNISVNDVLVGDGLEDLEKVYLVGGQVKISEVMKTMTEDAIKKLEYDKLPKEALDTYIDYTSNHDYDLSVGDEYVFILLKQRDDTYHILGNGYGVFKENSTKSTKGYQNVLTKNELVGADGNIIR